MLASLVLVMVTLPFSLCLVIKVVQEYERTVIFRLGRILSGGVEKIYIYIYIFSKKYFKQVSVGQESSSSSLVWMYTRSLT